MKSPELDHAGLDDLRQILEADLALLEIEWTPQDADAVPPMLLADTLIRLRREGLLQELVRVDWRQRLSMAAGIAAALFIGIALGRYGGQSSSSLADQRSGSKVDWAEGLVLAECFASPAQELEVRLYRLHSLLEPEQESGEETVAGDAIGDLRLRMDRLAEEVEVF